MTDFRQFTADLIAAFDADYADHHGCGWSKFTEVRAKADIALAQPSPPAPDVAALREELESTRAGMGHQFGLRIEAEKERDALRAELAAQDAASKALVARLTDGSELAAVRADCERLTRELAHAKACDARSMLSLELAEERLAALRTAPSEPAVDDAAIEKAIEAYRVRCRETAFGECSDEEPINEEGLEWAARNHLRATIRARLAAPAGDDRLRAAAQQIFDHNGPSSYADTRLVATSDIADLGNCLLASPASPAPARPHGHSMVQCNYDSEDFNPAVVEALDELDDRLSTLEREAGEKDAPAVPAPAPDNSAGDEDYTPALLKLMETAKHVSHHVEDEWRNAIEQIVGWLLRTKSNELARLRRGGK